MIRFRVPHRLGPFRVLRSARRTLPSAFVKDERGAALLEFAVALPLLVVFTVGIFDFSGAFNQRQKIEQAAQQGAIIAGAQPMTDIGANPASLQAVATSVFNSLTANGVVPTGGCTAPGAVTGGPPSLTWTYKISPCPDTLVVTINRGWVCPTPCSLGPPAAVGTTVTVAYPYHWRFNSVIQLLVPGATYAPTTLITESSTVHNQL